MHSYEQRSSESAPMKPSIYWLFVFVPITVILEHAGKVPPPVIFFSAALAIVPIAVLIVRSTEQIAARTGDAVGGLLNATFGNAPELIIALVALKAGYPNMVRASIIGGILANLLLGLGIAFFLGGIRHSDQKIQSGCRTHIQLDDAAGGGQPRCAKRVQPLLRTGRYGTAGRTAQPRNRRRVAADLWTLSVVFRQDVSRRCSISCRSCISDFEPQMPAHAETMHASVQSPSRLSRLVTTSHGRNFCPSALTDRHTCLCRIASAV